MVLCCTCRPWPAGTPLASRTRSPSGWPGTRSRSPPSASAAATSFRSWPSASAQPGSTRSRLPPGLTRTIASQVRTAGRELAACPATTSTSPCGRGTAAICPAQASCAASYGPLQCGKASAWAPVTTGSRPPTPSTFSRDSTGTRARTDSRASTLAFKSLGRRLAGLCRRPDRMPYRDSGSGPPGTRLAGSAGGTWPGGRSSRPGATAVSGCGLS
jgi:hypothetical protein